MPLSTVPWRHMTQWIKAFVNSEQPKHSEYKNNDEYNSTNNVNSLSESHTLSQALRWNIQVLR